MKKIPLGTGLTSAPIALGCMRISGMEQKKAEALIQTALENGIDLYDHADIYGGGESERLFGRILKSNPGMRSRMLVQGKCGICKGYYDASKEHIVSAVDGILERLGISELDLLLLHRPDALMDPEEVAEAFAQLEKSGKVKHFGVSNQNAAQLALLDSFMPGKLMANQLQFGLAHTGPVDTGINVNTLNDQAVMRDGSVLDYCRLHKITIQAWSPFQHGWFEGPFLGSDKYQKLNDLIRSMAEEKGVTDTAIAVAWIMRHPAKMQTIVGTTNEQRLRDIVKAADVTLTRPEWYSLYLAAGNPLP
jgi:predicted oxidoreductase